MVAAALPARAAAADVTAHGDALRALLEQYPGWRLARSGRRLDRSTSPSSGPAVPTSVAELASELGRDVAGADRDRAAWPADEANAVTVVPTLASIAASLSTHVAVLA